MAETASRPPLALIANHQDWSARSLESLLSPHGYTVLRARSGAQVLDQTRGANPDVYILDANLPDIRGTELCRALRGDQRISAATPILITVAGPSTHEQRLEGLRAGAWDFWGLPLDAEEVLLRLDSYVKAKFEADLGREEGLLDQLTGLYNIRGMLRRARELGSEASRYQRALACIVFSPELPAEPLAAVDEKTTSSAVDRIVRVFKDTARVSDAVGRLGNTEFVVLAPDTGPVGALRLAERLSNAAASGEAGETETAEAANRLRLRAGYYAVPNFHEASIEPVEMLVRATMALRNSQADPAEGRIRSFDRDPPSPG